jgi:hypothetical protein
MRQYLPIVLGLALLAGGVATEPGHAAGQGYHPPAGHAAVISATVDQQPAAAVDQAAPPVAPAEFPAASFRYPLGVVTEAAPVAGRVPDADGPRAPPRPGA